jgi:hypothetical protein
VPHLTARSVRGHPMKTGRDLLILILAGLLVMTLYRRYEANNDLQKICGLVGSRSSMIVLVNSAKKEINEVCVAYQTD